MKQRRRPIVYSIIMSMVFGMLFQFSGFLTKPTYAEETVVRGKGELTTPGVITLDDVQKTLRAALGIIELEGEEFWAADLYDNNNITLDNVRIILKAALGIIEISDVIPGSEEPEPIVTEPVVTEPVVTEPVITEPVETEPVVTEPVITEPVVTESVIPNYTDIICQVIDSYGVSSNFNLKMQYYGSEIENIVKRYAERGIEVTTFTFEELKERGIVINDPNYWWRSTRSLVSIDSIGGSATEIVIEGSVFRSGLSGIIYRTTFVIKDGQWVLDQDEIIGVS